VKFTFPKSERLRKQDHISRFFEKDSPLVQERFGYPFRIQYFNDAAEPAQLQPTQVLIGVSKRRFKKAVDRNRVKRCIREAYRLNKAQILGIEGKKLPEFLLITYIGNRIEPYRLMEQKLVDLLLKIAT